MFCLFVKQQKVRRGLLVSDRLSKRLSRRARYFEWFETNHNRLTFSKKARRRA